MKIAAYAPLASASFPADVVIFRGNVRQIMLLAEAAKAAGVFESGVGDGTAGLRDAAAQSIDTFDWQSPASAASATGSTQAWATTRCICRFRARRRQVLDALDTTLDREQRAREVPSSTGGRARLGMRVRKPFAPPAAARARAA